MIDSRNNFSVKLIDFGFAQPIIGQDSEGNSFVEPLSGILGTLDYMAPEIWSKDIYDGMKSDMFSVGVLLFVLRTGKMLFRFAHPECSNYKLLSKNPDKFFQKLIASGNFPTDETEAAQF